MDGDAGDVGEPIIDTLQWGHGREAMDGGNVATWVPCRSNGFNGAMAVRPWMAVPYTR